MTSRFSKYLRSLLVVLPVIWMSTDANAAADEPPPRDVAATSVTSWVEKSVEPISVFAPTTATFPLELSIDAMTQEEVDWVRQQVYDWAVVDGERDKQKYRAMAYENLAKGIIGEKEFKANLARAEKAHWGCFSWLFKRKMELKTGRFSTPCAKYFRAS